jgi:hypothetical protein
MSALDQRVANIEADILSEEAKDCLLAENYDEAYRRMAESVRLKPGAKRWLAAFLMRTAPRALHQVLRMAGVRSAA